MFDDDISHATRTYTESSLIESYRRLDLPPSKLLPPSPLHDPVIQYLQASSVHISSIVTSPQLHALLTSCAPVRSSTHTTHHAELLRSPPRDPRRDLPARAQHATAPVEPAPGTVRRMAWIQLRDHLHSAPITDHRLRGTDRDEPTNPPGDRRPPRTTASARTAAISGATRPLPDLDLYDGLGASAGVVPPPQRPRD